ISPKPGHPGSRILEDGSDRIARTTVYIAVLLKAGLNHMKSPSITTDVLIAGAGPVGLVLAMDLASRGVEVVIVEPRERLEPPSVKCNHVSARSMEIFRRLGVAS